MACSVISVTTELIPVQNLGVLAGMGTFYAWFLTIFLCVPILKFVPTRANMSDKKSEVRSDRSARYIQFINRHKNIIFLYGMQKSYEI